MASSTKKPATAKPREIDVEGVTIKHAESPPPPNTTRVVELFLANLRAIRDWYRFASPGVELGHNRIVEIACNAAVIALEHAILGKTWQPPT